MGSPPVPWDYIIPTYPLRFKGLGVFHIPCDTSGWLWTYTSLITGCGGTVTHDIREADYVVIDKDSINPDDPSRSLPAVSHSVVWIDEDWVQARAQSQDGHPLAEGIIDPYGLPPRRPPPPTTPPTPSKQPNLFNRRRRKTGMKQAGPSSSDSPRLAKAAGGPMPPPDMRSTSSPRSGARSDLQAIRSPSAAYQPVRTGYERPSTASGSSRSGSSSPSQAVGPAASVQPSSPIKLGFASPSSGSAILDAMSSSSNTVNGPSVRPSFEPPAGSSPSSKDKISADRTSSATQTSSSIPAQPPPPTGDLPPGPPDDQTSDPVARAHPQAVGSKRSREKQSPPGVSTAKPRLELDYATTPPRSTASRQTDVCTWVQDAELLTFAAKGILRPLELIRLLGFVTVRELGIEPQLWYTTPDPGPSCTLAEQRNIFAHAFRSRDTLHLTWTRYRDIARELGTDPSRFIERRFDERWTALETISRHTSWNTAVRLLHDVQARCAIEGVELVMKEWVDLYPAFFAKQLGES